MSRLFAVVIFAGFAVVPPVSANDAERMVDGQRVYKAACASCHDSGAGGAPVTGQGGDWTERSHLWEAVLFEHANKGYLEMPAQGGEGGLSEYDVDAAAEYMLNESFPDLPRD